MINFEVPVNTVPEMEEDRLKKVQHYEIMDTSPEADFDTIALLAAEIFEVQQASICFIDQEDVFFKASLNSQELTKISREASMYNIAILKKEASVIYDRSVPEDIKFFAAAPIMTSDGFTLGAICVTDYAPHLQVSSSQLKMLHLLSDLVMKKLETRLVSRKIVRAQNERFHRLSHDIKNPVTSISLYAQLLGSREMSREKVFSMAEKIEKSCRGIEKNLHELTS